MRDPAGYQTGGASVEPPNPAPFARMPIQAFALALRSALTPMHISTTDVAGFGGSIATYRLEEITAFRISTDAFAAERSEVEQHLEPVRAYALLILGRGGCRTAQASRVAEAEAGDIVAIDLAARFTLEVRAGSEITAFVIPQGIIDLPRYMINDYVAAKILNGSQDAAPIHAFLSALVAQLPVREGLASRYAPVVGQLAETLFRLHIDDEHALHTAKIVRFERIVEYLEAHLLDPGLTPVAIAEAHFISTRYLQEIFQMHGMTVTSWIRHRRLEQCRQALREPRNAGKSVSAIAAEWGFADAAYFSRAFRREFGVSPSSLR